MPPTKDLRAALEELMTETLTDTTNWTYRAVRPLYVPASWTEGQHVTADCSKGVQYLNKWAGAADPMGESYGPDGNSQTLWHNLQHLSSPTELLVGDIVTFGYDGNDHAAMVIEVGADPLLWSFGHQGAPNTYRLSQDARSHQFLRNPLPVYVRTPDDKLRGKEGWFAWMNWLAASGDWRHKAPKDKAVRPDIPKIIPPSWWARRVKFLAQRNKPNNPTT